jgi:hypothetical protein
MKPQVAIAIAIAGSLMSFAVAAKKPCEEKDNQMAVCMMGNLSDEAYKDIMSDMEDAAKAKVFCANKDILMDCFDEIGLFYLCSTLTLTLIPALTLALTPTLTLTPNANLQL